MDDTRLRRRTLLGLGALAAIAQPGLAAENNDASLQLNALDLPATPTLPEPATPETTVSLLDGGAQVSGFGRAPRDAKAWESVLQSLRSALPLTSTGTVSGELDDSLLRIEQGFAFLHQAEDNDFSPLHIEPLIDQAADLLDRGLRDRAVWDDLAAKMLTLALEIHEYAELDKIHSEEEKQGVYEVPARVSQADLSASQSEVLYSDYIKSIINNVAGTFSNVEANKLYNAYRYAAWITGVVPYTWQGQGFGGYVKHKVNGVEKTVSQIAVEAAEIEAAHHITVQNGVYRAQAYTYEAQARTTEQRNLGLNARAAWDTDNVGFQRRRTLVARRLQDIKALAATAQDGLLNYGKRLPAIKRRFHGDFRDALARLEKVQQGLEIIFGYADQLPSDVGTLDYFDECLLWARRAIQWLIRFSRQDQTVVVPISIRSLVGKPAWRQGLKIGSWTVDISEETFPNCCHVRLRGLSAFAVQSGCGEKRLRRVTALPPRRASMRHLSNAVVEIDQSMVPPCILARVTDRDFPREPDVFGLAALHNASPIGTWKIAVSDHIGGGPVEGLDDVEIDLHLAYRAMRNAESAL